MGLFGKPKQKDLEAEQLQVLLDKFEYTNIEKFCKDVIGRMPEYGNERIERTPLLEFIWKNYKKGNLNFQQIKDFAIKEGIVTPDFFN